jgi:hypothetical protein
MSAELEILLPETLESVPCALCGSWDTQEIYPAAERRNGHGSGNEVYACTSTAYGMCGPIVKCTRCGLVYQSPVPSAEEIIDAYDGVVDTRYVEESSGRMETFALDLDAVERHAQSGRLVDIGCHLGFFLDVAKARGWDVAGVEPSRWSVEQARGRGLDVRHGTLETVHLEENSFDVVTYMQMHLVYFSKRTLHNMLTKAGYQVVEMIPHKRVVRLSYLISRIEPYCAPLYKALDFVVRKSGQGDRLVGVYLGDLFTTVARKV